ncbi:uncharacterized protein LOC130744520 [Lotus japonicus]|uniref:uncharacterized protein LOC130744520 n=1 Tax=Lotus japonicus TaxID=34305 RepID=UPI00258D6CF2|nr:uncharacterized protein LOC130744520 [Lotus japonicus]
MTHLALGTYDGSTDPKGHLLHFNAEMATRAVSDAVKCRVFPSTFRGVARNWFMTLHQGSLAKFRDFSSKFLNHFSARTVDDLFDIRQLERETLKQYIKRYNAEFARFEELEPRICVGALKSGLSRGKFSCELRRERACSMAKVRAQAQGYILEEETEAHKRKRGRATRVTLARKRIKDEEASYEKKVRKADWLARKGEGRQSSAGRKSVGHWSSRRTARVGRRSDKELTELHLKAEIDGLNKEDDRKMDPECREDDQPKWCEYHNLEGHDTTDCLRLKGQIRQLIRARQPQVMMRKKTEEFDSGKDEGMMETANVIAVRCEDGDSMSIAGRRQEGETTSIQVYPAQFGCPHPDIVMSSADFEGIKPHEDDSMVVMVRINGFNMQRVLLDQGSSANIIYGDVFEQLGLTDKDLKPYTRHLVGFSGKQVRVRGYVQLDTIFGIGEDAELLRIIYLVLQVVATYNVIIGRGTLNRLQAVISTAHLAVKYPLICGRIGKIEIDQRRARKCHDHCRNLYGRTGAGDGHRCHEIGIIAGKQEHQAKRSQSDLDGQEGKAGERGNGAKSRRSQGEGPWEAEKSGPVAQTDSEWRGEKRDISATTTGLLAIEPSVTPRFRWRHFSNPKVNKSRKK